jgi:hypothetical protein
LNQSEKEVFIIFLILEFFPAFEDENEDDDEEDLKVILETFPSSIRRVTPIAHVADDTGWA